MTAAPLTPVPAVAPAASHRLALLACAAFLLVYGSELFGFTLSIDEEIATFVADRGMAWLAQGRWAMSLLTLALPNFEAIPVVSTVLFGLGLGWAGLRGARDFSLGPSASIAFVVLHTAFPLWLHVGEFNTLAGGFGVGIAAAAWGAGAAVRSPRRLRWDALLAIAFAIGVYQTLSLYVLLYIVILLESDGRASADGLVRRVRLAVPALLVWTAALAIYWLVQRAGMALFGAGITYVGGYNQIAAVRADPAGGLLRGLRYVASLHLGRHPIYLGWGAIILALPALGLLPLMRSGQARRVAWRAWGSTLAVTTLGVGMSWAIATASLGSLPARAHVGWPLLAAWLGALAAGRADVHAQLRPIALAAVAAFLLVATSIGATLFHADRVVHGADAALARQLATEMDRAAREANLAAPVPFVLVGQRGFPTDGQLQRAELFGTSFFEQDGGNVYRVYYLMRLQGAQGFEPTPLASRPDLVPAARGMPAWPGAGSVRAAEGVVLVKLGEPTAPQLPAAR